ncbi:MAG: hypothetical protein EBX40_08360 [Gammaproteobacteria bacterium]|nr:hypothetical protein [Gammaproteobacteria bacterium]
MSEEQTLPAGSVKASDIRETVSSDVVIADAKPQARPAHIMTLAELEKHHIEYALLTFGGNKTQAAKALGISLKTLYNKLHSYGMMLEKPENGK